jgi:hypothetical protein
MKLNRIKYQIAVVALFLVASAQTIEVKAQLGTRKETASFVPFDPNRGKSPFSGGNQAPPPPSYVPPPGGEGDAQKELPVLEGCWIIVGLAISYGIFCRQCKGKDASPITKHSC